MVSGSDAFEDDGFADPYSVEGREQLRARLEREIAETEADLARRQYERRTEELLAKKPDPPPLPPPPPKPAAVVGPDLVTRAMMDRALGSFAEAVGEATGTMGREAEKRVADEIAALRDEATARENALRARINQVERELIEVRRDLVQARHERLDQAQATAEPVPNGAGTGGRGYVS